MILSRISGRSGALRALALLAFPGALGATGSCQIDLPPLQAKADAAGLDAADAGGDACNGCQDAAGEVSCPANSVVLGAGRCCPANLELSLPGTYASGLLLQGDDAIVYGERNGRAWAARVDRCDGAVLAESTDFVAQDGRIRGAALSGDQLVLGGSYLVNGKDRWFAAWGSVATMTGFAVHQTTVTIPTIVSAVAVDSGAAWFAGTYRFGAAEARAMLARVNLTDSTDCISFPGGASGEGGGVFLDSGLLRFASKSNGRLYAASDDPNSCGILGGCKCGVAGALLDLDGRFVISTRAAALHDGALYAVGGSATSAWPVSQQGVYVARSNPDLSLAAKFIWVQPGNLIDDARGVDVAGDGSVAVAVARGCSDLLLLGVQDCSFGAILGLPANFDASSQPTFATPLPDVNEVTGVRYEPEPSAGILVAANRYASSYTPGSATLMRCTRDGKCP